MISKYEKIVGQAALSTIREEGKADDDVYADMKKQKAAGGASGGQAASGRSYQFNQRAYKKYHSTKTLVERILKSHSEGNRFIRNEDL